MTMEEMWGGKDFHRFASRVFDYDPVYYSTVPIGMTDAKFEKATTWLDRTGLLFRVANIPFLITAKHGTTADNTIGDIFDAGYRAFIAPLEYGVPKYVEVRWRQLWISSRDGSDHAVFELTQEMAEGLEEQGQRFLGMGSVMGFRANRSDRSLYLVSGYPTAEKKDQAEGQRWDYYPWLTVPHYGHPDELPFSYDPGMHFLLNYNKQAKHTSGKTGESPVPKGMSGGGVWFIRDFASPLLWSEDQIKLIAVQSGWFAKSRVLKAVWVDEALAMIWHRYSDSRDLMRLHGFEYR